MEVSTKDTIKMERSMDKVYMCGWMIAHMMEIGERITLMDM